MMVTKFWEDETYLKLSPFSKTYFDFFAGLMTSMRFDGTEYYRDYTGCPGPVYQQGFEMGADVYRYIENNVEENKEVLESPTLRLKRTMLMAYVWMGSIYFHAARADVDFINSIVEREGETLFPEPYKGYSKVVLFGPDDYNPVAFNKDDSGMINLSDRNDTIKIPGSSEIDSMLKEILGKGPNAVDFSRYTNTIQIDPKDKDISDKQDGDADIWAAQDWENWGMGWDFDENNLDDWGGSFL